MYFPDDIILPKAIFLTWRRVLTLTRIAPVSVPIVAETCARRGAGFSRFLQLVPGEGESQTTGKLCVLHFLCQALDATLFSSGWPVVAAVHTIALRTSYRAHNDDFQVITPLWSANVVSGNENATNILNSLADPPERVPRGLQ